jgi:RHS repeat-associated protein
VNYTYDNDSRLTQVSDPTGTYQFTFDPPAGRAGNMGRLTGTTTNYTFLTGRSFTDSYSYDAASNRTSFTDPESGSTTYAGVYPDSSSGDTLNRLTNLTDFGNHPFTFSYDALSRRTQMTRANNVTTNYSYDNLSRLQSVLHQLSGSTIDGASYTVDNAGNRTAKTDQRAAVTSNYGYDAIYELLSAMQGGSTTESYTYDPVGNRTASLGVSSYSNNASNELTSTSTANYTYDANGNTQTKVVGTNTTTYAWDFENRMSSVTLPGSGGTVSFKYDPFGRRIYKSSTAGTSVYAYDGDNLIEETNSSGTAVARYSQTQNIDEPLAMLRSSTTSYYHADGLGSVTSLSNTAGSLVQTYQYDSFGKQMAFSGSLTNPFQYTAREFDAETGLYYYRARYYDQNAGRFLSEDPIGFRAGVNFYAYVRNDPTVFIDPNGLLQVCTRRANVAPATGWARLTRQDNACHTFVRLSNGDTLGGYFSWSLGSFGDLVKNRNDNSDHNKFAKEAKCTDLPGSPCDNDARAEKAFNALPKDLGPYGVGPMSAGTSNAVTLAILTNAGFNWTPPSCAWGAVNPPPLGPNSSW